MSESWWNRVYESVADKGRELLNLEGNNSKDILSLCKALLAGAGEASGKALAREVIRTYNQLDEQQQLHFLDQLCSEFSADHDAILASTQRYTEDASMENYLALQKVIESPRQELFRRINLASNGTPFLVGLRKQVLSQLRQKPELKVVDADFQHLFRSWFNPGFLRLRRIDWNSPASVLEKLISYEAVHEIQGWDDLRRRLADDRRCFAFFHPALPDEPLIFVEVALVKDMASEAQPILDHTAPVMNINDADSAIFYSINNCQDGLRGISFGNFLIKQVMAKLMRELPNLKLYATFSPVPGFANTLLKAEQENSPFPRQKIIRVLGEKTCQELSQYADEKDPVKALFSLLEQPLEHREILGEPLQKLALTYLALVKRNQRVVDPVAFFHLYNGARLERINIFADHSEHRLKASFGVMVNYLYEVSEVEKNHEALVSDGTVALSKNLTKAYKPLAEKWADQ